MEINWILALHLNIIITLHLMPLIQLCWQVLDLSVKVSFTAFCRSFIQMSSVHIWTNQPQNIFSFRQFTVFVFCAHQKFLHIEINLKCLKSKFSWPKSNVWSCFEFVYFALFTFLMSSVCCISDSMTKRVSLEHSNWNRLYKKASVQSSSINFHILKSTLTWFYQKKMHLK